jgi:hypothetical protein
MMGRVASRPGVESYKVAQFPHRQLRARHFPRRLDLPPSASHLRDLPYKGWRLICGYARVSTAALDLAPHITQLKAAGCDKVFREKITGTIADRPQLRKLIVALAPGDVVIRAGGRMGSRRPTQSGNLLAQCSLALLH